MGRLRWKVGLMLLLTLAEGCSTSAAIERRSGPTIVGHIDSSDANWIYVTGDDDGRYRIERSDVADIDHPGKIGTVVGAIISGFGASFLLLAPLAPDCSSRDPSHGPDCWNLRAISAAIGVAYLLVGAPILIRNMIVHSRSVAATTLPPPPPPPLPARLPPP
jgi:hypothetical protein